MYTQRYGFDNKSLIISFRNVHSDTHWNRCFFFRLKLCQIPYNWKNKTICTNNIWRTTICFMHIRCPWRFKCNWMWKITGLKLHAWLKQTNLTDLCKIICVIHLVLSHLFCTANYFLDSANGKFTEQRRWGWVNSNMWCEKLIGWVSEWMCVFSFSILFLSRPSFTRCQCEMTLENKWQCVSWNKVTINYISNLLSFRSRFHLLSWDWFLLACGKVLDRLCHFSAISLSLSLPLASLAFQAFGSNEPAVVEMSFSQGFRCVILFRIFCCCSAIHSLSFSWSRTENPLIHHGHFMRPTNVEVNFFFYFINFNTHFLSISCLCDGSYQPRQQ